MSSLKKILDGWAYTAFCYKVWLRRKERFSGDSSLYTIFPEWLSRESWEESIDYCALYTDTKGNSIYINEYYKTPWNKYLLTGKLDD